jgi:hypothetical protein
VRRFLGGCCGDEQTNGRQCPQGRSEEADAGEGQARRRQRVDQTQQGERRVYGREESNEKDQGRERVQAATGEGALAYSRLKENGPNLGVPGGTVSIQMMPRHHLD